MFSQMSFAANLLAESTKQTTQKTIGLDVKKRFFYVFLFWSRFYRFLFSKRFFLFLENVGKVQSDKQINKKHFQ